MTSRGEHIRLDKGSVVKQHYEVVTTVGSGNFSKVYRVIDLQLPVKEQKRKPLAMKVIKKEYSSDAKYEKQMLISLHKNDKDHTARVSKMYECFVHQDCPVFIMPIHGPSIRSRRLGISRGVVTRDTLLDFALDVIETMAFVHFDCHMVHTDLKPENILIADCNVPETSMGDSWVVCDFGSASLWRMDKLDSDLISTRPYRAPEVVLGNKWHYAADMWSVGCILYEVATGHRLFEIRDDNTHLHMMERRIGHLPDSFTKNAKNSQKFFNSKGEFLTTPEAIRLGKSRMTSIRELFRDDKGVLQLLEGLFIYNPDKRMTAKEALKLPIFVQARAAREQRRAKDVAEVDARRLRRRASGGSTGDALLLSVNSTASGSVMGGDRRTEPVVQPLSSTAEEPHKAPEANSSKAVSSSAKARSNTCSPPPPGPQKQHALAPPQRKSKNGAPTSLSVTSARSASGTSGSPSSGRRKTSKSFSLVQKVLGAFSPGASSRSIRSLPSPTDSTVTTSPASSRGGKTRTTGGGALNRSYNALNSSTKSARNTNGPHPTFKASPRTKGASEEAAARTASPGAKEKARGRSAGSTAGTGRPLHAPVAAATTTSSASSVVTKEAPKTLVQPRPSADLQRSVVENHRSSGSLGGRGASAGSTATTLVPKLALGRISTYQGSTTASPNASPAGTLSKVTRGPTNAVPNTTATAAVAPRGRVAPKSGEGTGSRTNSTSSRGVLAKSGGSGRATPRGSGKRLRRGSDSSAAGAAVSRSSTPRDTLESSARSSTGGGGGVVRPSGKEGLGGRSRSPRTVKAASSQLPSSAGRHGIKNLGSNSPQAPTSLQLEGAARVSTTPTRGAAMHRTTATNAASPSPLYSSVNEQAATNISVGYPSLLERGITVAGLTNRTESRAVSGSPAGAVAEEVYYAVHNLESEQTQMRTQTQSGLHQMESATSATITEQPEEDEYGSPATVRSVAASSAGPSPRGFNADGSPRATDYRSPARHRPPVVTPTDEPSGASSMGGRQPSTHTDSVSSLEARSGGHMLSVCHDGADSEAGIAAPAAAAPPTGGGGVITNGRPQGHPSAQAQPAPQLFATTPRSDGHRTPRESSLPRGGTATTFSGSRRASWAMPPPEDVKASSHALASTVPIVRGSSSRSGSRSNSLAGRAVPGAPATTGVDIAPLQPSLRTGVHLPSPPPAPSPTAVSTTFTTTAATPSGHTDDTNSRVSITSRTANTSSYNSNPTGAAPSAISRTPHPAVTTSRPTAGDPQPLGRRTMLKSGPSASTSKSKSGIPKMSTSTSANTNIAATTLSGERRSSAPTHAPIPDIISPHSCEASVPTETVEHGEGPSAHPHHPGSHRESFTAVHRASYQQPLAPDASTSLSVSMMSAASPLGGSVTPRQRGTGNLSALISTQPSIVSPTLPPSLQHRPSATAVTMGGGAGPMDSEDPLEGTFTLTSSQLRLYTPRAGLRTTAEPGTASSPPTATLPAVLSGSLLSPTRVQTTAVRRGSLPSNSGGGESGAVGNSSSSGAVATREGAGGGPAVKPLLAQELHSAPVAAAREAEGVMLPASAGTTTATSTRPSPSAASRKLAMPTTSSGGAVVARSPHMPLSPSAGSHVQQTGEPSNASMSANTHAAASSSVGAVTGPYAPVPNTTTSTLSQTTTPSGRPSTITVNSKPASSLTPTPLSRYLPISAVTPTRSGQVVRTSVVELTGSPTGPVTPFKETPISHQEATGPHAGLSGKEQERPAERSTEILRPDVGSAGKGTSAASQKTPPSAPRGEGKRRVIVQRPSTHTADAAMAAATKEPKDDSATST